MKQRTGRKLLRTLLAIGMVIGSLPMIGAFSAGSLWAQAYDGNPYSSYVNNTETVQFANSTWYIIADGSTAENEGTVTLFKVDPITYMEFGKNVVYSTSTVREYLKKQLTLTGFLKDWNDVLVPNGEDYLYLLTKNEANKLPNSIRKCKEANTGAGYLNDWWLQTIATADPNKPTLNFTVMGVSNSTGTIITNGFAVSNKCGVRPACKVDLSKVTLVDADTSNARFERNEHTVTWQNDDGTVIRSKFVPNNYVLQYTGDTPVKAADAQYTYTFSGWSNGTNTYGLHDTLPAVTSSVTYTAQYSETVNQYNVTLPENMEISNGITLTDGKADYGTEISFKVKDGYAASNVKANGTDLTAADGVYTVSVEGDTEITADIKKVYADGIGERLKGYSVSLEGDIGVNFYMELDESVAASENAYMQFTLPNSDTPKVPVSEAAQKTVGGKTYYVFKCNVSAKDMASEIKAQIIDGDKAGTEYKYSVKDYAEYILEHNEVEEYANAEPLVKAMLNYGAASQRYFKEGTAVGEVQDMTDVTVPNTFKFDEVSTALPVGVTFEGATLSLKSETTLSLYFKGLPADTKFICNAKTVETVKNGEYVVARIRGIKASELENDFTVTFKGESMTYNVMAYCYNVLNGGSYDKDLQNVCKALYLYAQAAKTYSE